MSDRERDDFLLERRIGVLAMGRSAAGPLLAPIWYGYTPGGTLDILMGGSTAKAARLRAEGRASVCVHDDGRPYRYVTVEGPVSVEPLGEGTYEAIRTMATRYLGDEAGRQYADAFQAPDEVVVRMTPQRWRTEVIG